MKIKVENINLNSNSGPNYFSSKLIKYLKKIDKQCINFDVSDVTLCFTETHRKTNPLVQRLDGIWFNSNTDYKSMNRNYKKTYELSDGVIYQSDFDKKLLDENIKKFRTINYLK